VKHICDCGQRYSTLAALEACQAAGHSAAAGCELADAEAFARENGIRDGEVYCAVCGEDHFPPACVDDFPEPGEMRETGK
jgi:hypothetical protein